MVVVKRGHAAFNGIAAVVAFDFHLKSCLGGLHALAYRAGSGADLGVMEQRMARLAHQLLGSLARKKSRSRVGLVDLAVGRDDQRGVGHCVVGAGSARQHAEGLTQGAVHQCQVNVPIRKDLEQMPDQVGCCVHAHIAGKGQFGQDHEHHGCHQVGQQARGHEGTLAPQQCQRTGQQTNDHVFGVNLERRQPLAVHIGGGKEIVGNQRCAQHRGHAKARLHQQWAHAAVQKQGRRDQRHGLDEAGGYPQLDGRVGTVAGQQLHAVEHDHVQ